MPVVACTQFQNRKNKTFFTGTQLVHKMLKTFLYWKKAEKNPGKKQYEKAQLFPTICLMKVMGKKASYEVETIYKYRQENIKLILIIAQSLPV